MSSYWWPRKRLHISACMSIAQRKLCYAEFKQEIAHTAAGGCWDTAAEKGVSSPLMRQYPSGGPCCAEFEQEGRPLQLRDVAALLRKSDDPQGVLRGLRVIGPLIEAAPEELSNTAGR